MRCMHAMRRLTLVPCSALTPPVPKWSGDDMDMRAAVQGLGCPLGDTGAGLPPEVFLFLSRVTPLLNVDLLIQDDRGRTLLTWRDDEFFGAGWHVPGGI